VSWPRELPVARPATLALAPDTNIGYHGHRGPSRMTPQLSHLLVTIAIVALVAWRLPGRIRRLVGRQRLSPVRPWITVVVFPLLVALLALGSHNSSVLRSSLAVGVVLGIALGGFGLRRTYFEVAGDGLYYTPNAHLGIALSVLVVGRLLWRFLVTGMPGPDAWAAPAGGTTLSPLTRLLIGTLAGYYFTYAVGLLRWASRQRTPAQSQLQERP
jgi:hypothetical protein